MAAKSVYIQRVVGILVVLLLIGGIYFLFSPEESGFFPQCAFHSMTGLDCPGCGSQRAIHHLLHFRIREALSSNLLLVVSIPYIIICLYMGFFGGRGRYPKIRKALLSKKALLIIFILIALFWVIRNVA